MDRVRIGCFSLRCADTLLPPVSVTIEDVQSDYTCRLLTWVRRATCPFLQPPFCRRAAILLSDPPFRRILPPWVKSQDSWLLQSLGFVFFADLVGKVFFANRNLFVTLVRPSSICLFAASLDFLPPAALYKQLELSLSQTGRSASCISPCAVADFIF